MLSYDLEDCEVDTSSRRIAGTAYTLVGLNYHALLTHVALPQDARQISPQRLISSRKDDSSVLTVR